MKKLVTIIMLITLLACCTATAAFASAGEDHVVKLATANEKVLACECAIYRRACVVALKTEKFTTKSEYDEFAEKLTEQIKTDCEVDYVFVTRSPKVMHQLAELNKLSDEERTKAIEELIAQQLQRHGEHKTPPKMLRFKNI